VSHGNDSYTRDWNSQIHPRADDVPAAIRQAAGMTSPDSTPQPRSSTIAPIGGIRLAGRLRLPRRLVHVALVGGMDLDLSQAELTSPQLDIVKVSLVGGVDLVVPAEVRVEVRGFVLLGGKDVERRPGSAPDAPVVRVRAFGLIGGVRVRVADAD
jgi:Cell wall-active antibiotics response 4TMS YvqF